ncbi:hypothetical protein [Edaphobacter modestus]|uniref:Uncharacterized protein n=1 Tax=Edaphobacter modestus TaxID=388466 RepID=A0A4Q7YWM6_9BACT|nr:hypothetical protein [Edaphobacter modestus]RZU41459.1 hypothetical protein BDD14_2982 [Edaphobacter modestus]
MKRSTVQVVALLLAAALALMAGCRKPEMQRCVNPQNIVVDDDLCHSSGEQRVLGQRPAASSSFRYYYGGSGSTEGGTLATGGSYMPERDHTYAIAGREHQHLKNTWPLVGIVGVAVLLFFAWQGRRGQV